MLFLGDLCLSHGVENNAKRGAEYDLRRHVGKLVFPPHDINIANLECCISDRGEASPEKFASLRATPAVIDQLDMLNVALLANNHVGDFGKQAAWDTQRHLESKGIRTIGYGRTLEEALQPLIIRRNNLNIGILSLCCLSTHPRQFAMRTSSGVAPLSLRLLKERLITLYDKTDVIFVCLHWGKEGHSYPTLDQMRFARRAIDFGAHMVIGCHAHVIQAYEQYRGRWIFYGLGNFLFPPVPVTVTQPDGSQEHRVLKRPPSERESLGVLVGVERTSDGVDVSLEQVIYLKYGDDLVPRRCRVQDLTCDIPSLNKNLRLGAMFNFLALRGVGEIQYRTEYTNRKFKHFYSSRDAYPVFPWKVTFGGLLYRFSIYCRKFFGKLNRLY